MKFIPCMIDMHTNNNNNNNNNDLLVVLPRGGSSHTNYKRLQD